MLYIFYYNQKGKKLRIKTTKRLMTEETAQEWITERTKKKHLKKKQSPKDTAPLILKYSPKPTMTAPKSTSDIRLCLKALELLAQHKHIVGYLFSEHD